MVTCVYAFDVERLRLLLLLSGCCCVVSIFPSSFASIVRHEKLHSNEEREEFIGFCLRNQFTNHEPIKLGNSVPSNCETSSRSTGESIMQRNRGKKRKKHNHSHWNSIRSTQQCCVLFVIGRFQLDERNERKIGKLKRLQSTSTRQIPVSHSIAHLLSAQSITKWNAIGVVGGSFPPPFINKIHFGLSVASHIFEWIKLFCFTFSAVSLYPSTARNNPHWIGSKKWDAKH